MNDAIRILKEILEESRQYDGALIYISEYHWKALEMAIDALQMTQMSLTESCKKEGVEE